MDAMNMPGFSADQRVQICVVGVGYVGTTLLLQFGDVFNSIGFDISEERIRSIQPRFQPTSKVMLTTNPDEISTATHFFITVPTVLRKDKSINLNHVISALKTVCRYAAPGSCIVIESSVPVGATRQLLGQYQHVYHCGMSPERIDPGRVTPSPAEIPKLVSALTPIALKKIVDVYSRVFKDVRAVSKPEVAEMTKLFENCYRMVNIAYVNEMSDACRAHGVNPFEMIDAAASKPFGFQPFYPGLGVGGHCIPVNPFYLLCNNKRLPVLEQATNLMLNRPRKLARRFYRRCLKSMAEKAPTWPASMPRILVVGLGFKAGQSDISGSPALSFIQTLNGLGCTRIAFYDPLVEQTSFKWLEKLTDAYWTSSYIDNKFDGLYICNNLGTVEAGVVKGLEVTVVGSYVHIQ